MKTVQEFSTIHSRLAGRYPDELVLQDQTRLTITPMVPSDWQLLEQFLREIPDEEKIYLRHDASDPEIVERWCAELDYESTLPLFAWDADRIAADAALQHDPDLWTAHVGRIRLTVHPKYRGRGLGPRMVQHVLALAEEFGLHQVVAECAAEQEPLISMFQHLGFREAARLPEFVRDRQDRLHDLVVMVYRLESRGPLATASHEETRESTMKLELTDAEQDFLVEITKDRLGTLREQVHHVIVSTFHDELKEKEALLRGIIEKLESAEKVGEAR